MRARTLLLAAALLAPAGCGGGSSRSQPVHRSRPMPSAGQSAQVQAVPEGHGRANPKVVAVIRGWSDALRGSHVARATAYFAVPSVIQSALDQPPVEVRSRRQARAFNTALPCGATLLR